MSLSFQHWVAGTCPEILHVRAYSAGDVLLRILCMTQKIVRTRGQWPDSGMLVFKKSDWGEVYMMPMSMEWVKSGVDGDWKARVLFGLLIWTVTTLRMAARVGEERSTAVQVHL